MKLIVGLGNPGKQYEKTRHNIGFLFLDFFAGKHDFPHFKKDGKLKAEISTKIIDGEKIILCKPQAFMNFSGESTKKVVDFYKIPLENYIIIYDDISLKFGKIRFRNTGSAGGHNGIKNIIQYFSQNFKRIKIGISYDQKYNVSDWVLSKFTKDELTEINDKILADTLEGIEKNFITIK